MGLASLACIVPKSLAIWEQSQALAAQFSGYAEEFRCFWKVGFQDRLFQFFLF